MPHKKIETLTTQFQEQGKGTTTTTEVTVFTPHLDLTLKTESILLEEFKYAALVASAAHEARSRMFNLYLILAGILVSGLGTLDSQYNAQKTPSTAFIWIAVVVLFLASVFSIGFFIRLLDLSCKYRDGILSMNAIKEFYIEKMPWMKNAFRWRIKREDQQQQELPIFGNFPGTTFLMGAAIAILGSLYLVASLEITFDRIHSLGPLINFPFIVTKGFAIGVICGLAMLFGYFLYYRSSVSRSKKECTDLYSSVTPNVD